MKSLYEYSILLEVNIVIAAETQSAARGKAESLTPVDILEVIQISDEEISIADKPDLCQIKRPSSQEDEDIECEAHFVVKEGEGEK